MEEERARLEAARRRLERAVETAEEASLEIDDDDAAADDAPAVTARGLGLEDADVSIEEHSLLDVSSSESPPPNDASALDPNVSIELVDQSIEEHSLLDASSSSSSARSSDATAASVRLRRGGGGGDAGRDSKPSTRGDERVPLRSKVANDLVVARVRLACSRIESILQGYAPCPRAHTRRRARATPRASTEFTRCSAHSATARARRRRRCSAR
jgi:hypothetical protein